MERLLKARAALKARTTTLMQAIDTEWNDTKDEERLESMLKQLMVKSEKLSVKDEQIEEVIPEDLIEKEVNEVEEFREAILDRKAKIERYLLAVQEKKPQRENQDGGRTTVNLPRVTIPKFNGDPTQWRSFWDQYRAAIHEKIDIGSVTKFVYLRSYMEGAALNALAGLTLTEENYERAVDILEKRFGRKGMAINSHLNKITSLTAVKRSSDIAGLRFLYDTCDVQVKCLEALGVPKANYGYMFCHMVIKLLPQDIALDYSRKLENLDEYDVSILMDHLKKEVECRERATILSRSIRDFTEDQPDSHISRGRGFQGIGTSRPSFSSFIPRSKVHTTAVLNVAVSGSETCCFCNEITHKPEECKALNLQRKMALLSQQDRCFLCLKPRHTARRCKSKKRCDECQRRHHKSICRDIYGEKAKSTDTETTLQETAVSMTAICPTREIYEGQVLLQTIVVYAEGNGKKIPIRCLLDNGAQKSFITQNMVERLKLPVVGHGTITVGGFESEKSSTSIRRKVKIVLSNLEDSENQIELVVYESPKILGAVISMPGEDIRRKMAQRGVKLADIAEVEGQPVQKELSMLIAADYYWTIVTGVIHRLNDSFVAMESRLGWAVQGPLPMTSNIFTQAVVVMNSTVEVEEEITVALKAFWEIESIGIKEEPSLSKIDEDILAKHNSTIQFRDGRYEVQLPWRANQEELGNNLALARRRMSGLIKKFQQNPVLYHRYQDTFNEYLKHGIVEEVPQDLINSVKPKFYIPHFPVIREDKDTTKFRIVYDAAAHEKNQPSLNSLLSPGPNLNPDLLLILMRFRRKKISIMADVEKAFLMISLAQQDREFTRFLWIKSVPKGNEPIEFIHLRMTRVLFGVSSSPFLLAATLKYHFAQEQDAHPKTCQELMKSLYVDDLVSSVTNVEEGRTLYHQSKNIFTNAGMNIRKWVSNSKELSELWQDEGTQEEKSLALTSENSPLSLKVLGISWNSLTDVLTFNVSALLDFLKTRKNTKRSVLQAAGRVFDPIGFLSPFLIRVKCLFQKLWVEGIDWDMELPPNIQQEWDQWCLELPGLRKISIPRWYHDGSSGNVISREIHLFCDASKLAYGAVTYLRYETDTGETGVSLIASKTRVAPIKELTIPRLELMAALIGARLLKYTKEVFEGEVSKYYCWSDSTIVVQWIQRVAREWKPFVANRVAEIHELTEPSSWSHCAGANNPADFPSRGCSIEGLLSNTIWWKGPPWLLQDKSAWPKNTKLTSNKEVEAERRITLQLASHAEVFQPIMTLKDYSSVTRVIRVTAWILRFIKNSIKVNPEKGPLNAEELDKARKTWIRQVQRESYPEEISRLREGQTLSKTSKIIQFNPFLQEDLLRVGGRLQNSNLEYRVKHPYLLPSKHKFSELLAQESHFITMHGGLNNTLTQLREDCWMQQGRQMVKRIISKCIVCRRFKVKAGEQNAAPLPLDRVKESPPFNVTGIDFAGPLYVRSGQESTKVYIALFTCGVTRAIHLELVSDMSADKFMMSFRRFVARRGIPSTIYSDNAKSFKRTDLDLRSLYKNIEDKPFQEYLGLKGIKWRYIVERAAWWGGFWERLVRTVKTCLKKTLGKNTLSYEELQTSLTEIEAVVNSRPLTYNNTDPNELIPLSPSHFLIGQRATAVPDQAFTHISINASKNQLTRKLKHRQAVLNQFWNRWRNNYLLELRSAHSSKAVPQPTPFKVDDVVLIEDSKLPRHVWRMGRIIEVFPGRDGKIRACQLRLPGAVNIRRAVQSLYNLEINDE